MTDYAEANASEELTSDIASWDASILVESLSQALMSGTPLPWYVREDADPAKGYYLSGPPETRIVADSLSQEDVIKISTVFNDLPDLLEHFRDLLNLWNSQSSDDSNRLFFQSISNFQIKLALAEGGDRLAPEVKTAEDITFRHIGGWLFSKDAVAGRIRSVSRSGDLVCIGLDSGEDITAFLSPDLPVSVVFDGDPFPEKTTPPNTSA